MKKLLSVILGGLMLNVIALAPVKAEDSAAPAAPAAAEASAEVTATPAADAAAAPAADASAAATASADAETKAITFADGKTGEIHQEHVYITRFGGLRMAAPDGEHKLSDGTSITVKGGMLVSPDAAPAAETAPAAGSEAAPEATPAPEAAPAE